MNYRRVDDAFDIKFKAGKSDIPLTKHQVRFKKKIENIRNDIKERGRKAEKIAEGEDGATNKYIQKRYYIFLSLILLSSIY